ncbi:MAG: sugar phosphate isomerase/epimerase [Planctomycetaceae bacterium]|jgi:inosose dehydratase|nr:sugar phosphate isomerase/epimerase [Planctomycetaceae bacterium]
MLRRLFLKSVVVGSAGIFSDHFLRAETDSKTEPQRLHVAVNQFAANNFYRRDGKNFLDHLKEMKSVGVDGLEPMVDNVKKLESITSRLKNNGLEFRSIYISGNLHDSRVAAGELARLNAVSKRARELGAEFAVFNPAAKHGKNDAELKLQTENVNKLGAEMAKIGIKLAFHYHTVELEFAGREFYHLLNNTDPKNLSLCLEQHWSYRGTGNSQAALFDHLKLFRNRISVVHLRQSINNVWSETFGDGDIDNVKLASELKLSGVPIHFVLEQVSEKGTPKTMPAETVLSQSCNYIRRTFGNNK